MTFPYPNKHQKEQCLRINMREDPSCLDPRRGRNMAGASQVQAMLFEGLMRLESDGSLACAQARSYTLSSDQKTYVFHLRGTCWSDGSRVTAEDFVSTWKEMLDPAFPALDVYALFCVKNGRAAKRGELPLDAVGLSAPDADTVVVELEHPTLHFLHITASAALFPISQAKARLFPQWPLTAGEHFVSNGPFRLSAWYPQNEMLLEKNTYYRNHEKVKLDTIVISMINSGIASLHMHVSGLFDIIGLPLSPLPFDLHRELAQKNLLQIVKTPGTMVCMFNTEKFPFHNAHLRRAFSYAINRKVLVETITLLKEQPALSLVPPMLREGREASFFKDDDTSAARACFQQGLDELGITARDLKNKLTFSFWKCDHGCPMLPQALQQQWKEKLGVEVELEALDFTTLHEKGRKGLFSMGYFVPLSMYYDPMELLDRYKYASNPRNYSRWHNDAFASFLDQAEQTSHQEEHRALLERAERVLMEEMPLAPIFHWNYALLVQPHVKGFSVSPLGYLCMDHISIENNTRNSLPITHLMRS